MGNAQLFDLPQRPEGIGFRYFPLIPLNAGPFRRLMHLAEVALLGPQSKSFRQYRPDGTGHPLQSTTPLCIDVSHRALWELQSWLLACLLCKKVERNFAENQH